MALPGKPRPLINRARLALIVRLANPRIEIIRRGFVDLLEAKIRKIVQEHARACPRKTLDGDSFGGIPANGPNDKFHRN